MLLLPAAASAYKTAPGYSADDYATGFPVASCCGWGPIGVAFDRSDNLYVSDPADGNLYRFQPGGGLASSDTRLTRAPLSGGIKALAFTRDERLYLARGKAGDVVEIDPATGAILRTVVGGIECATGLAADPVSGDLFVSQGNCTNRILRISDFSTGPGTATPYAATPCCADGLALGPDGTMYAASGDHVVEIQGTSSPTPGLATSIATVPDSDGLAVGVPRAGDDPFIVVNTNDGRVARLVFSQTPPSQRTIFRGGTRGDFVAVDSRGCLYITQTSAIVRLASSSKRCDLAPSTPGAGAGDRPVPGITIDTIAGLAMSGIRGGRCIARRRLVVRVRQRGRVRLRVVRVYVNGRRRKVLRHRRVSARIVIRHVPRGKVRVKLVARTRHGRKLKAKRRYRNCRRRHASR